MALALTLLLCALATHDHHAVEEPARYTRSIVEARIPAVTLTDLNGAPVPLAAELDREGPVVLQFVFTTCSTVCPVLTGTLAASQGKWPGVRLVSITIDPEEDTPARLRDYAARFHAGPAGDHWRFLTGKIDDIVAVQQAFGAYRGDKMRHEPLTFLRAAPRQPWVRLAGFPSAAELDAEVRRLLASGRRIYLDGALLAGQPLESAAASCASCHRRSGYGSVEGTTVVPPITAPALFGSDPEQRAGLFRKLFQEDLSARSWASVRDPRARPPYTDATLAAALRDGRDPTGRELDPLMPRYQLDPDAMANLIAYLQTLSAAPDPGVEESTLHLATVVTEDADPGRRRAMLDVMEAYVRWKDADVAKRLQRPWPPGGDEEAFSGGYRRWELHVWELRGPATTWTAQLEARYRERPVFAVLGGLGEGDWSPVHTFCERTRLPCLFPETDLPVTTPGDWTVYLSPGLAVEAQTMAHHLRYVQGEVVQVYRNNEAGRAAARALRQALAGTAHLEDQIFAPDVLLGKRQPAALVLWLSAEDLASLPPIPGARVYLSSTLLGEDLSRLPEAWRDRSLLAWRWSLPGKEGPHAYRVRAWLRARGIAPGPERLQLDTWLAFSLADTALMHLADRFSRDLFLETVERETERMPNPGVYPRLSLGPGQRFASKGCYLVRLTPEGIEAVDDWLVP